MPMLKVLPCLDSRSMAEERRRELDVSRAYAAELGRTALPAAPSPAFAETRVQVTNETTLGAARRLADAGASPLALNFANGAQPGGGFLDGARAQEEVLCGGAGRVGSRGA